MCRRSSGRLLDTCGAKLAKALAPYDLVLNVGSLSERLSDECRLPVGVYGTIKDLRYGGPDHAGPCRSILRP